jgi:hypothetical protein
MMMTVGALSPQHGMVRIQELRMQHGWSVRIIPMAAFCPLNLALGQSGGVQTCSKDRRLVVEDRGIGQGFVRTSDSGVEMRIG